MFDWPRLIPLGDEEEDNPSVDPRLFRYQAQSTPKADPGKVVGEYRERARKDYEAKHARHESVRQLPRGYIHRRVTETAYFLDGTTYEVKCEEFERKVGF